MLLKALVVYSLQCTKLYKISLHNARGQFNIYHVICRRCLCGVLPEVDLLLNMKALILTVVLIGACFGQTPTRPNIPETFESQV